MTTPTNRRTPDAVSAPSESQRPAVEPVSPAPPPTNVVGAGARRPLRFLGADVASYLGMLLVVLTAVLPVLLMIRIAFTPPAEWLSMPVNWTAAPYLTSFSDVLNSNFPHNLANSFIVGVATTVLVVILSAMAGHALARMRSRHKERFLFFVLSTRMGPAVVFALPIYLLAVKAGLVDTYLGLVAVYTVVNLAFGIWMMHGFFLDIPGEVEEAGLMDGLSEWGVFWRVSLRMAVPGLIATAILVFVFTWNEFFYAFVLTRQVASTFPVSIPGYFGAFRVDWGQMFAASTLGVLPPVVFGIVVRRWLARGLSGGLVE
jgi:multiple sugar transport system permease protein